MTKKLSIAVAVVVLLGMAGVAGATPVIQGYATTVDSVTWTYSYVILNPSPTSGDVFDLYVPAWGTISSVQSPDNWYAFWGTGFVEWSADFGYEVGADEQLGGFSFDSTSAPGYWSGVELSTDDGVDIVTYDLMALQPVPEPTTMIYAVTALGFGAGVLGLRSRRQLMRK